MRYNHLFTILLVFGLLAGGCKQYVHQLSDDGNMALGNPTHASHSVMDPNNYLVDHGYYMESYNKRKTEPNWVSWHLCSRDLGTAGRSNNFRPDTTLPSGWYEAENYSYKRTGFDKGHNCPSGDRTSNADANSSTFLLDNIVPQAPNNNEHVWEHLESYCRNKVKKGYEAYIIMGAYGSGGTGRKGFATAIDKGRINVPAHLWKVVILLPDGDDDLERIDEDTTIIAIDTPNDNNVSNNWMNYVCTVKDIEHSAGLNLLSALPVQIQEVLENKRFSGGN